MINDDLKVFNSKYSPYYYRINKTTVSWLTHVLGLTTSFESFLVPDIVILDFECLPKAHVIKMWSVGSSYWDIVGP